MNISNKYVYTFFIVFTLIGTSVYAMDNQKEDKKTEKVEPINIITLFNSGRYDLLEQYLAKTRHQRIAPHYRYETHRVCYKKEREAVKEFKSCLQPLKEALENGQQLKDSKLFQQLIESDKKRRIFRRINQYIREQDDDSDDEGIKTFHDIMSAYVIKPNAK